MLRTGEVSMTRRRGIAKWLNRLKGFGFIEADSGCVDVYTHYSEPENNGFDGLYHLDGGQDKRFGRAFGNNKLR